jgi:hypothetical protein
MLRGLVGHSCASLCLLKTTNGFEQQHCVYSKSLKVLDIDTVLMSLWSKKFEVCNTGLFQRKKLQQMTKDR